MEEANHQSSKALLSSNTEDSADNNKLFYLSSPSPERGSSPQPPSEHLLKPDTSKTKNGALSNGQLLRSPAKTAAVLSVSPSKSSPIKASTLSPSRSGTALVMLSSNRLQTLAEENGDEPTTPDCVCPVPSEPTDIKIELPQPIKEEVIVDDDDENEFRVEPPDGGWGWVIVFSAFLISIIIDGIIFSFGVIYSELLDYFQEGTSHTAWVGSLLAGCYLAIGPVVSALANRFSCRSVGIAGSILGCFSFILSSMAPNLTFLFISYGILGGIGFGMVYLPAIVMVQFYFEKRRALATGIAVCGSGIGTFIMAPVTRFLIREYGWQGTMLIQAAIILNCAAVSGLLRPLKTKKNKMKLMHVASDNEFESVDMQEFSSCDHIDSNNDTEVNTPRNLGSITNLSRKVSTVSLPGIPYTIVPARKRSESSCPAPDTTPPPSYEEALLNVTQAARRQSAFEVRVLRIGRHRKQSMCASYNLAPQVEKPFYRKDIFYSGSVLRLPRYESSASMASSTKVDNNTYMLVNKKETTSNMDVPLRDGNCIPCEGAMWDTLSTMLDFTLFQSPTFNTLCFTGFLTMMGIFIPFVYLVDYAMSCGISKDQSTLLLSAIGVTNTVGRIISGWLSDWPNINALFIYNMALTTGGIATMLIPFFTSLTALIVLGAAFGFSIACFASLRSIILVDLLGLERLTNSFGLIMLFQGIASIIGSPSAGFFYDLTGTYNCSFWIGGGLLSMSGLIGFIVPYINKWELSRQHKIKKIVVD